ncbi:MAG: hypothetical protein IKC10_02880 [Alphaproteobacteria bacterium]|nr:hypothetical protein [Alphaproteobacteria bacterium]
MDINQNENRPKLKKIKRPINRTAPIGSGGGQMQTYAQPQATKPQNESPVMQKPMRNPMQNPMHQDTQMYQQPIRTQIPDSKILNEYLDGGTNLPDIGGQNIYYHPDVSEDEYYEDTQQSEAPSWLNVKVFVLAMITVLFIGVFAGKIFFTQSAVVKNGLQGVVVNPEVPRGRARCGIAERSQGCVLYIMNPQRQEMSAKDFYDLASQVTGRQRFMIETGNMRYANSKIKPGDIVQLNIPPL